MGTIAPIAPIAAIGAVAPIRDSRIAHTGGRMPATRDSTAMYAVRPLGRHGRPGRVTAWFANPINADDFADAMERKTGRTWVVRASRLPA